MHEEKGPIVPSTEDAKKSASSKRHFPQRGTHNKTIGVGDKKTHISIAPRERVLFHAKLRAVLLILLRHPEALVTDESRLWDFCSDDSDEAKRPGSKPGYFIFEHRYFKHSKVGANRRNPEHFETMVIESRAVPFKRTTIRKIFRHTGVDITPVFDEYLYVVLQYLADHISEEARERTLRRLNITP
ncbi:MAG: hypothetical protein ABSD20_16245 [Terriglobales bacterium]|jgi:hypothetical protein